MRQKGEWDPAEDELLGRLVDLAEERDAVLAKITTTRDKSSVVAYMHEVAAIEAEQQTIRGIYHG